MFLKTKNSSVKWKVLFISFYIFRIFFWEGPSASHFWLGISLQVYHLFIFRLAKNYRKRPIFTALNPLKTSYSNVFTTVTILLTLGWTKITGFGACTINNFTIVYDTSSGLYFKHYYALRVVIYDHKERCYGRNFTVQATESSFASLEWCSKLWRHSSYTATIIIVPSKVVNYNENYVCSTGYNGYSRKLLFL